MHRKYAVLISFVILLVLLSGCTKKSNTNEENVEKNLYVAYKIIDNQKVYGYIDEKGLFLIEPQYMYASDYSEGFAVVYDDINYRIIDINGNTVFETTKLIEPVKNGAAIFTDPDTYKRGFLDINGLIIAEPVYQTIENFNSEGTALVSSTEGIFERIDKTGKTLQIYHLDPFFTSIYEVFDGYAAYMQADNSKMGIISIEDSRVVIDPSFNEIIILGEGYFAAKDPTKESFESLSTPSAIMDSKGNKLSDYQYYDVSHYHEGLASATDDQSTFFIGTDGQKINTLPVVAGRGILTKIGALIKADIDGDLSYLDSEGNTIWQADTTIAVSDQIKVVQNSYKPLRLVNIKYPSVTGLKDKTIESTINETLKDYFTLPRSDEDLLNLSVEDVFSASLRENLLIIEKNGYDYYSGAAHGMPIHDYYYIDINTGVAYTFKDLFKEDSDYLNALSMIVTQQIQEQATSEDSMFFPEFFTGLTETTNFQLTENGIIIYFYPYEIAAYAGGFPEFEIPFADITEFLNEKGNFFKSFNP